MRAILGMITISFCPELDHYDPELLKKPRFVVANKIDEAAAEVNLRKFKRRVTKTPVFTMSAAFDIHLAEFLKKIRKEVELAS